MSLFSLQLATGGRVFPNLKHFPSLITNPTRVTHHRQHARLIMESLLGDFHKFGPYHISH